MRSSRRCLSRHHLRLAQRRRGCCPPRLRPPRSRHPARRRLSRRARYRPASPCRRNFFNGTLLVNGMVKLPVILQCIHGQSRIGAARQVRQHARTHPSTHLHLCRSAPVIPCLRGRPWSPYSPLNPVHAAADGRSFRGRRLRRIRAMARSATLGSGRRG